MYRRESISIEEVGQAASSWPLAKDAFSEGDVEKIVTHMQTANKLMIHDGVVPVSYTHLTLPTILLV